MKSINSYLKNNYRYYAHLKGNGQFVKETLEEHSDLVFDYYKKITRKTSMIDSILASYFDGDIMLINAGRQWYEKAIYLHDLGKINRNFQISKMKNISFGNTCTDLTQHSIYSAILFLHIFEAESQLDIKGKKKIRKLCVYYAYMISKHHGYLRDIEEFIKAVESGMSDLKIDSSFLDEYKEIDSLIKQSKSIVNKVNLAITNLDTCKEKHGNIKSFEIWLLCKTLFSHIVTCDFYATGHYMSGKGTSYFGEIEDISSFTKKYYDDEIVKNSLKEIKLHNNLEINDLRTKMSQEASKHFIENINDSVFYLEAPTGSGKTRTSINLAVKAIEKATNIKRIFYVFPFNTLIEQTANVLNELFDSKDIGLINSIEPIKTIKDEDYQKMYLDHIMIHFPILLMSHVRFFDALIGTSRESHLMLSHMSNSIVIIDEIQSYKNMIWKELIEIIHLYAKHYNIKFIIMSATLPKMSELIDERAMMLIKSPQDYYNHPIFKDRTVPDFTLLENKIELDDLVEILVKDVENQEPRILIEFIDKVNARAFYLQLKSKLTHSNYQVLELTGDDPSYFREDVIQRLKQVDEKGRYLLQDVIVVATQVIEAGVDIDMNKGYKDISILDNEEQFAGRINRSCKRENARIYFFDLFNEKVIYKDDVRTQFSLRNPFIRDVYKDKNFKAYFEQILKVLNNEKSRFNKHNIEQFYKLVKDLKFDETRKYLRLIDNDDITIFIPTVINVEKVSIDGKEVWNQYNELLNNTELSYPEKQIKLSQINKIFSYFTYNVRYLPLMYRESIGERVYLLESDAYIVDGKFDRKAYNETNGMGVLNVEELMI